MRRKLTILAAATALLMVAGVAFAAWTASGTGSGSATATSHQAITVGATATGLFPTGSVPLAVSITNPNGYRIDVTKVEVEPDTSISTTKAGCSASTVSFATQNLTAGTWVVAGSGTRTFEDAVSMTNAAEDECQGASFTIPLKVTAASTASSAAGSDA